MMMKNRKRLEGIEKAAGAESRTLAQETVRRFKKNKYAVISLLFVLLLLLVSLGTFAVDIVTDGQFYADNVVKQDLMLKLETPSAKHIFGCDEFGRDMFWRIVWGTRCSLLIGLFAVCISLLIGGLLGAVAGYFGGMIDNVIMRVMDVLLGIPYMLLAIAIVAALGTNIPNLLISIAIPSIPGFARITRASVISVKDREFIEAARATGAGHMRILFKYVLTNAAAPVIVHATLCVANAILSIASLSYLSLGVQPPTPEWGAMLSSAKTYMRDAWHITVIPGLAIMLTVLALNIFGDGLRDALDPKLKN